MTPNFNVGKDLVLGYFIDPKTNYYYSVAKLDDDGVFREEVSGSPLRDYGALVQTTAKRIENGLYIIDDNGNRRSGLRFISSFPIVEANMSELVYKGFECAWVRESGKPDGVFEILHADESRVATHLLMKICWNGNVSLMDRCLSFVRSHFPEYVRNCASTAEHRGVIWTLIPKKRVVEDLLF